MGILERLRQREVVAEKKRLFGVVAGPRLGGKSTLAGTLPGRTLLLQAAVLESGSESAKLLAEKRGGGSELWVETFTSVEQLQKLLTELKTDEDFDNVYVDSLSAVSDMKYKEPKITALIKTDNWAAFRVIGDVMTEVILQLKELTYADKAKKPKNTWITCALTIKTDKNGAVADVSLDCKGNVGVSAITKYGECVVTVLPPLSNEGGHRLITKTQDWWPGRIDGILREQNPGVIEPADLSEVLKLRGVR